MRKALLIGLFTLAAGPSFAQTDDTPAAPDAAAPEQAQEAPAAEAPAQEAPAEATPAPEAEATPPPTQQPDAGEPANLCQELLSFMQTPPPEPAAPTEAAPARQDQSGNQRTQEGSPEGEGTAQQGEETTQQSEGTPQQASGSDGPAHAAPEQQSAGAEGSDAEGDNEQAQQTSSLSAPVPTEPASTPKLEVMTVAQAEDLAAANDIQACKDAARELRLAGVAMPPPLLALTALDLQYQQTESQAQ